MSLLMSRYILEIEKDSRLLELFANDYWYPDFDQCRMFLRKQEKIIMILLKQLINIIW